MSDGHDPNGPTSSIDAVHDPEAPDAESPEPLQFALEQRTDRRVGTDGAECGLDWPFDVRREVAKHVGHVRRDVELERHLQRARFLAGTRGSPNTSSKDRPFALLA
jgi:hypothetical protein